MDKEELREEDTVTKTDSIAIKDKPLFKIPLRRKKLKTFKEFIEDKRGYHGTA